MMFSTIGGASSVSLNVLENDADYECLDHGRYTTQPFCDMYIVNFTQPRYGTVKFPDAKPIFPEDEDSSRARTAASQAAHSVAFRAAIAGQVGSMPPLAAAAAAGVSGGVGRAAGLGTVDDWKVNGQLQYSLDPSVPRPLVDAVSLALWCIVMCCGALCCIVVRCGAFCCIVLHCVELCIVVHCALWCILHEQ
jgi:hypothetical protein